MEPADSDERTTGHLKALLVLRWNRRLWITEDLLRFPPFPGLGIRLDAYVMLLVDNVVVGDPGYDVTCICSFEGGGEGYTEARVRALGFEEGGYP
jgi:hypothetical protein